MSLLPPSAVDRDALAAALSGAAPRSDYARGVRDLLRLLGLIDAHADRPADEVAAMLIDSLRAHLADDAAVGLRWGDLDGEGLRGVDVLRAVEAARLAVVAAPTPGRVVQVAQAVIKTRRGGQDMYLMQYDTHAGRYQPLGGKRDPADGGTAAALRRELMEELDLPTFPGPEACTLTLIREGWRTLSLSATYGVLTAYVMDFYAVSAIRFPIPASSITRWITRDEIAALRAADGRAITSVYQEALGLEALDALPPDGAPPGWQPGEDNR